MDELNFAIALYVGKGLSAFPKENEGRVIGEFGEHKGKALVARIKVLLQELHGIKPDWDQYDLAGASRWAVDRLRERHTEIDPGGAEALEWIFSWWWK